MTEDFTIDDYQSGVWQRLEIHLNKRREKLREILEKPGGTFDEANHTRGQIAEVKRLLSLSSRTRPMEIIDAAS